MPFGDKGTRRWALKPRSESGEHEPQAGGHAPGTAVVHSGLGQKPELKLGEPGRELQSRAAGTREARRPPPWAPSPPPHLGPPLSRRPSLLVPPRGWRGHSRRLLARSPRLAAPPPSGRLRVSLPRPPPSPAAATAAAAAATTTTPLPSFLASASAARVPPAPAPPPSCPPRSPPGQAVGGSGAGEAGGLALAPRGSVCALRGRTRSLPRFSRPPSRSSSSLLPPPPRSGGGGCCGGGGCAS